MATQLKGPVMTHADEGRGFWFLDTLVVDRTPRAGAVPTVLEMTVPPGGSPPEHTHETEDDSFYVLDGRLAIRCDGDTFIAGPGDYVALPCGRPHTFRVVGGRPARLLLVHETDAFLRFVEGVGVPAEHRRLPSGLPAIDMETLARGSAELAHAPVVGAPMSEEEVKRILGGDGSTSPDLRSRVRGVVHVMLTVRDLRVSEPWYRELFGLTTTTNRAAEDGTGHVAMLHPPTGIVVALRAGEADDPGFDEHRVGLDHLAFGVTDRLELDEWAAWLAERHIPHGGIADLPFGSGLTVHDPDGIPIELFAPPAPI